MSRPGWIKIYRKITDWDWWDDHNTTRLFIYLLCTANHEEKDWKGKVNVEKGQLVTSIDGLAKETGLSPQQIRRSLGKLTTTGEITKKSTNHFSIITICKYKDYQQKEDDQQQASEQTNQQANRQQLKNIRNKEIPPIVPQGGSGKTEDIPADSASVGARDTEVEAKALRKIDIDECLNYLNEKTGANFKLKTERHRGFVNARMEEGATLEEMKAVVDVKTQQWLNDTERSKFLRPSTLFNSEKYDGYVAESRRKQAVVVNGKKYNHERLKEHETYMDRIKRNKIDPRDTDALKVFFEEEDKHPSTIRIVQDRFEANPSEFPYVQD